MRSPIRRCAVVSPISARTFSRASRKRRKRSPYPSRPKSTNGGRASKGGTSGWNEPRGRLTASAFIDLQNDDVSLSRPPRLKNSHALLPSENHERSDRNQGLDRRRRA